jgi:hypothetical protein
MVCGTHTPMFSGIAAGFSYSMPSYSPSSSMTNYSGPTYLPTNNGSYTENFYEGSTLPQLNYDNKKEYSLDTITSKQYAGITQQNYIPPAPITISYMSQPSVTRPEPIVIDFSKPEPMAQLELATKPDLSQEVEHLYDLQLYLPPTKVNNDKKTALKRESLAEKIRCELSELEELLHVR